MRPDLHPQPDLDGPYSWFRLGLCVVAGTILSIGMWGVILILPQVQAEFGVGRGDAALSYTATMLGFAAGNFLLGRYVDRYGIAAVMAAAALALGAGFALAAIAPNIWIFALVQAVIGIATAAGFGPLIADVSHWFRRRRGIARRLRRVAGARRPRQPRCLSALAMPLCPLLAGGYSWRRPNTAVARCGLPRPQLRQPSLHVQAVSAVPVRRPLRQRRSPRSLRNPRQRLLRLRYGHRRL